MKFRPFNEVISSRRWIVAAVFAAALLASPVLAKIINPTYQATASLALVQDGAGKAPVFSSVDVPHLITISTIQSTSCAVRS